MPDFFAFYRSMTAYENGLRANDTRFLLRPDSDFFRFFGNPSGKTATADAGEAVELEQGRQVWPPFVQTRTAQREVPIR